MRSLALKAFLGVLVPGLLPSFAYADHHSHWHGGGRSSFSLSFGFGGWGGGYGYYPRSYGYGFGYSSYYPRYYRSYDYYTPVIYAPVYSSVRYYDDDYCPPARSYSYDRSYYPSRGYSYYDDGPRYRNYSYERDRYSYDR